MNIFKSYAFWAVIFLAVSLVSMVIGGFMIGIAYNIAYPGWIALSIACLVASLVIGSE